MLSQRAFSKYERCFGGGNFEVAGSRVYLSIYFCSTYYRRNFKIACYHHQSLVAGTPVAFHYFNKILARYKFVCQNQDGCTVIFRWLQEILFKYKSAKAENSVYVTRKAK